MSTPKDKALTPVEQAFKDLEEIIDRLPEEPCHGGYGTSDDLARCIQQNDDYKMRQTLSRALASLKSVEARLTFDREGVKKAAREWILAHDGPESEDDAEHILEDLVQRLTQSTKP